MIKKNYSISFLLITGSVNACLDPYKAEAQKFISENFSSDKEWITLSENLESTEKELQELIYKYSRNPDLKNRLKTKHIELLYKKNYHNIENRSKCILKNPSKPNVQNQVKKEYEPPYKEEKYMSLSPKEKIKTRGQPSLQFLKVEPEIKQEKKYPRINIEAYLSSNNYETFCKFFDNYFYNTTNTHISISFKKFSVLCDALNQNLKKNRGGSSHHKLNIDSSLINNSIKNAQKEIKTIAKRTYLIPDQISDLRDTFLRCGLYPEYLEDILREKKLLGHLN